jgi:hypothetical protein
MNARKDFAFTLPRGYVDAEGVVHREGTMRLATAMDEIAPLKDARVQSNAAYLGVILLSRVVTTLGTLPQIYPRVIEELPVADFAFLQAMYRRVNENGHDRLAVACPQCAARFDVETSALEEAAPGDAMAGGSMANAANGAAIGVANSGGGPPGEFRATRESVFSAR